MRTTSSSSDYHPLGYLGRVPIHITTILAALYVAGMLLTTLLGAASLQMAPLAFSTEEFFLRGRLWQPFTCTFLNPPSFFFLFGIFFFYSAGIEVERYLGRNRFLKLFVLCLLSVPAVLGLWRLAGVPGGYVGMYTVAVAMFIAFATLYPNIEYWGWVPLKYLAFACFAIACLQHIPQRDWTGLSVLAATSGVAFGYVRFLQNGGSVEWADWREKLFGPRRNFQVLPNPSARERAAGADPEDVILNEIDPLLDKIARSGLASLTRKERARLEKARQDLMKRESSDQ